MEATTGKPMTIDQAASLLVQPEEVIETAETEAEVEQPEEEVVSADEAEYADEEISEPDTENAAEETEEKHDLIPVKIDGKIEMWTLDQLKQSAAGQGYIQKQMREAAEAKKSASDVYQQLLAERQELTRMYQQLANGQLQVQQPKEPSEELLEKDPIGYMQDRARYEREMRAYQQTLLQMQQMHQQQEELNTRARQAFIQDQMKLLQQAIPDFADKKAGTALRDQIVRTATEAYGFEPDELSSVIDHRHVRVLHDAMRYRQMMAERKGVEQQKVAKARPVVKPGAQVRQDPQRQVKTRQMAAAKRSGKVEDFVNLLFN